MTKIYTENPHIIAPALYGGTWSDDLDSVLHWTWIEHWETHREKQKTMETAWDAACRRMRPGHA